LAKKPKKAYSAQSLLSVTSVNHLDNWGTSNTEHCISESPSLIAMFLQQEICTW
jgi:hypothetical protein